MSNKITEKYFVQGNFADHEERILAEIAKKTGFQPEKEIFRGQIYDKNKVSSLIYKGIWQDKNTVLKIQGLQPEIDEIDIIDKFNKQNQSKKIRLPKLYEGQKWNKKDGYGFMLTEYVNADRIYEIPLAFQEQIIDFCTFYQEYKAKCLNKSLFEKDSDEKDSLFFTEKRVFHWTDIARSKGVFTDQKKKYLEWFYDLAKKHLPSVKMEFMHGHLTSNDIFKVSDNEYVLMSNLFWSYRPEYYDTTFHIWAGIKGIQDIDISVNLIIGYINDWIEKYKKLPIIKKDFDFERKFNLMMLERSIGTLLVDIENQKYDGNRDTLIIYLNEVFTSLFEYFAEKL